MNYIPLLIILFDQITKRIATYYFERNIIISFWKFSSVYTCNRGISFSFLANTKYEFLLKYTMLSVILITFYLIYKSSNKIEKIALYCIAAGGFSNLLDRILFNGVIDFIHFDFSFSPIIFNFADISITFGAVLLVINTILSKLGESNDSKIK